MKDTYIFGIQTNIDGTMRDLTRARDCIARGDYTVAQMILLNAAEKLTGAAQWQFAATGTDNATTPDDAAQIYNNAIKHNLERAKNDTTDPENLQTVADLRAQLKAGDIADAIFEKYSIDSTETLQSLLYNLFCPYKNEIDPDDDNNQKD